MLCKTLKFKRAAALNNYGRRNCHIDSLKMAMSLFGLSSIRRSSLIRLSKKTLRRGIRRSVGCLYTFFYYFWIFNDKKFVEKEL